MRPYIYIFIASVVITFSIAITSSADPLEESNRLYENVLKQYLNDGLVDYAGIKSNPHDLDKYLAQTSLVTKEEFSKWNKDEQLAFLINLYNAQTLDLVANNYPVASIKDIAQSSGGPWEQPVVSLFGERITLNALEHEVIRANYPDARVHFALVCAALSCPVLINTPYQASEIDTQLNEQTKVFLMDKDKNSIDIKAKVLRLSPIFDWFKEDFIKQSGSVVTFVNPFFENEVNNDFRIEYSNYDWTLNDFTTKKN